MIVPQELSVGRSSARATCSRARDFFRDIPFDLVFHHSAFSAEQADAIVFRRNAEVLVPDCLPLVPHLRFVACRSIAERQTLLHLLPLEVRRQWASRVRLGERGLFFRQWTMVEEVTVVGDTVTFGFNPNTKTPGPFGIDLSYLEDGTGAARTWHGNRPALNGRLSIRIQDATSGVATLYLDGALAFAGRLIFEDIPF